eukprot:TRINITY_DN4427_c1_g1_i1.p2 TRINITY_DN4427_c1_g1~~TRINITY_DN4427_c1_g1_i1.p2  ORF type:complete len:429 (+),score=100.23 TRINITY_DN4427_c1_g1_i1:1223-2509(+)
MSHERSRCKLLTDFFLENLSKSIFLLFQDPCRRLNQQQQKKMKRTTLLSHHIQQLNALFESGASNSAIQAKLDTIMFDRSEWELYVHFDDYRYVRNLLACTPHFSLVLNCWKPTQGTPIHTHSDSEGKSNNCWMRVLHGSLTLSLYTLTQNGAEPDSQMSFAPANGTMFMSPQRFGVHKMSNDHKTEIAVSLHLFSPPLLEYQASDKQGCGGEWRTCGAVTAPADSVPQIVPIAICSEEAVPHWNYRNHIFASFFVLIDMIKTELSFSPFDASRVTSLLQRCHLNPKEWKEYAEVDECCYSRNLIAADPQFSLYLISWNKGQSSRVHDHSQSRAWIKVLEGELRETRYSVCATSQSKSFTVAQISSSVFSAGQVDALEGDVVHKTENVADGQSFSLHLYAPSFKHCGIYNETGTCTPRIQHTADHLPA